MHAKINPFNVVGDSTMGGLLPHFWEARLSTFSCEFWNNFSKKFRGRKKRNTFDRFLMGNKWKFETI